MINILKHKLNDIEGIKLGIPGTNELSQMNRIVLKNEIKELKPMHFSQHLFLKTLCGTCRTKPGDL